MGGPANSLGTLAVKRSQDIHTGDLVEYVPNMGAEFTGHGGMGIVIRVDSNRHHPMAEIMWAFFPEQGPVWFNIANLRVVAPCNLLPIHDRM